jgi:hypothetical protein
MKQKGQNIMKNLKETKIDFESLAAMSDDDIDCSDIPELSEEFLASVKWMIENHGPYRP